MSATAAKGKIVRVSTTSISSGYSAIGGLDDASFNLLNSLTETTSYDSGGKVTRIPTLQDKDVPLSGNEDYGDSGQDTIRSAAVNQTSVFIEYLSDGVHGFRAEFLVENYQSQGAVADKNKFSASLKGTGTVVVV